MNRVLRTPDEPAWPSGRGPFLLLLDAASRLERDLLEAWIRRHRPPGDVTWVMLPPSRRRRRLTPPDPRLPARLGAQDDPLLLPLRVVWLAPEREGHRRVTWREVLTPGDPRDPDALRQRLILATHPDRCRIVLGAPARKSDLLDRHARLGAETTDRAGDFADFVALQAWLTLERAERELRGVRYKVPKFLREALYDSPRFQRGVLRLAREEHRSPEQMRRRTLRYLREIAATHSPYVIDVVTGLTRRLIGLAYQGLDYAPEELRRVYAHGKHVPLVFLPSHKSNFDHLVLQYVLYENAFPPNHTAGGINMNFFPIGPFLRRSGTFFIRRQFKDNAPYKFVLRRYLEYLLEKRFPLEWYIEGGRSRTGKLREPRLGLLAYVVDAYRRGIVDDVVFVPVSIVYDQISDVAAYSAEQRGRPKEHESFRWLLRNLRNLRRRYGTISLRIGRTLSLRDRLPAGVSPREEDARLVVPKLAFEIASRINAATPITPISLVALVLLGACPRALTLDELLAELGPVAADVERRGLPTTAPLCPPERAVVGAALDALAAHGVVHRHDGPTETVYAIAPQQHLAAAYYRNTIIHFFVEGAIAELALAGMLEKGSSGQAAFLAEADLLRDLLKFEFFFAARPAFREALLDELRLRAPGHAGDLAAGRIEEILTSFRPLRSPAVLRPFLEAYLVVADVLALAPASSTLVPATVRRRALALGGQYLLQGTIRTHEAVSTVLFDTAIRLATHRGLLAPDPERPAARDAFAAEVRSRIHQLTLLEHLPAMPGFSPEVTRRND